MNERAQRLLAIADDELILGWRDSEWTGIAPTLEEDVAFSSIAQNEIGHARALYELAAAELGTDADALAFDREPDEYRCAPLVELHLMDWAHTIARRYLYEEADRVRLDALKAGDDAELAGLAAKIDREETYHRLHAEMWAGRLRESRAFAERSRSCGRMRSACSSRSSGRSSRAEPDCVSSRHKSSSGTAHARAGGAVERDDRGAPLGAGRDMVTADAVWAALDEIPDPEIPVISLVDLGVVRDVAVDGEHVRIEFTPTFLGCPALEVMRRAMEDKVAALGGEAEVAVIQDDSWSTDRISPAGREKLREAGLAPPTPRAAGATTLVQLQSKAFRCPYCGSTETRLENIFGPTPCRSIRWCESCRQPFEQFKTI